MNLCRDCNSEYERPGTCNCFAPGGKRAGVRLAPGAVVVDAEAISPAALFDAVDAELRRRAVARGGATHPAAAGIVQGLLA